MARTVAHSVNPFLFGTGSWVYSQIRALKRWEALVVCKRRENRDQYPLEHVYALTDRPLPLQGLERVRRRLSGGAFPFMVRALREHGATLLHSHFAHQGWLDLPLARAAGVAHATSFYGADIWKNSRSELWRQRYLELFARGDRFFVEGNAMREKVISLGCPPDKVTVQHLGVQLEGTEFAERRPAADGLVRVLVSGRAVEKKGFPFALEAFARAVREAPHLRLSLMVIASSEPERARLAELHELVRSLKLESTVDFPPPRPYVEYRRSLYGFHVFFAPSRHASDGDAEGGAPVSLIDMSATGMPIVASRHCDIPEVSPHGVAGLLFDENDLDGAARALVEIAAAPARWPGYGRDGRAHVEREYSISTQAAKLELFYDELAAKRA